MCRKLIYLMVALAIVAASAQVARAQFITAVAHRNTDTDAPEDPEIAPNPLDEDELCFVDRTHQYNQIPAYLIGADYVLTANDNKNVSSYQLDVTLSPTIPQGTKLYLFIDNRMGGAAGGLGVNPIISGMPWVTNMGFTDTGDDIGIDESGDGDIDQYSSVFSLVVTPGTITLGGCTEGHGGNMYGVAVMGPRLKARDPSPPDGADDVITPLLQWKAGDTAAQHDVYFGTNPSPGPAEFMVRQSHTVYYAAGVIPGTTYYWRIDEVEADGTTIHTGNVWTFTAVSLTAYRPNPPDGAVYVSTDVLLSWRLGANAILHDVYFGTDEAEVTDGTGDTFKTTVATTTFQPGPLTKSTTYYWRIDEFDGITKHKGQVWSFETVPDIPVSDPNLLLWWKFDEGAGVTAVDWSGHDHHGTLADDPQWVEGIVGGALEFDGAGDRVIDDDAEDFLNGLDAITVCMWIKSDLVGTDRGFINCEQPDGSDSFVTMRYDNAGGNSGNDDCLKMAVTTTSGESQLESSSNTQTTEWQHVTMTWSSGELITFYINAVEDTGADRNNPNNAGTISGCSTLIIGAGAKDETTATEGWDGLIDDVRIYDKALTVEEIKEAMRGDTSLAWDPSPAHGATTDVEKAVPLSWSPGDKAAQHDVYLGTDQAAVKNADASDTSGIYRGQQSANSYTPPEGIQPGQTYYWRIDEFNTDATLSQGRVWRFTVVEYLIVDDFEGYTDDVGNRIFQTWKDGWGYSEPPPGYAGNGTGSGVGNSPPPYAEQTIVHGGRQSMPFEYNNTGAGGKARYSEAQREWASPQDWTRKAVKALTLYFYGDPANAAEQLYVALEDNAGQVRAVNHPNLDVVQRGAWQEWNIALTQFSGTNLTAVKKLYIGLGNRVSPAAGGSGKIYIDDIRLYAPRCVPSMLRPDADIAEPYDCKVDYKDLRILAEEWLFEALLQDWQERVAYWDVRYTGAWGGDGVAMRDGLAAAGYTILDADQLKTWMDARIADKKLSVVVFCLDVVPDTVCETMSATCTLRRYLDAGGKIVWYADIPMYYVGYADGTTTTWGDAGAPAILGFNTSSVPRDTYNDVVITGGGVSWGLTQTWQSRRPAAPGITTNLTVLAIDDAGNAAAWAKHYLPGDKARGFVRIWDTSWDTGGTPPVADVISVAESKGYLAANLYQDGVVDFKDFAVLADAWLDKVLWP